MGKGLSKEAADLAFGYVVAKRDPRHFHHLDDYSPDSIAAPSEADSTDNQLVAILNTVSAAALPLPLVDPDTPTTALTMGQLTDLRNLSLCGKGFLRLSPNIALLETAESMQLCCNHLVALPPELGYMTALSALDLSRNKLQTLPEAIGYLEKLQVLTLTDNQLIELPRSIGCLPKLTTLLVSNNRLTALPSEIGQIRSLCTLDASHNPLQTLPAELARLPFLRKLKLSRCPLLVDFPPVVPPLLAEAEMASTTDASSLHEASVISHAAPSPTQRIPTLAELAARALVRYKVPVSERAPISLRSYLASVQFCSFCRGPYFEHYHRRWRFMTKSNKRLPLEYRLCSPHWNSEAERVRLTFSPLPATGLVTAHQRQYRHLQAFPQTTFTAKRQHALRRSLSASSVVAASDRPTTREASLPPGRHSQRLRWFRKRSTAPNRQTPLSEPAKGVSLPGDSAEPIVTTLDSPLTTVRQPTGTPRGPDMGARQALRLMGHQQYCPVETLPTEVSLLTPGGAAAWHGDRPIALPYADWIGMEAIIPQPRLPPFPSLPKKDTTHLDSRAHGSASNQPNAAIGRPGTEYQSATLQPRSRPEELGATLSRTARTEPRLSRLNRRIRNPLRLTNANDLANGTSSATQSPRQTHRGTPSIFSDPNSLAVAASSSIYSFPASPESLTTASLPVIHQSMSGAYSNPLSSFGGDPLATARPNEAPSAAMAPSSGESVGAEPTSNARDAVPDSGSQPCQPSPDLSDITRSKATPPEGTDEELLTAIEFLLGASSATKDIPSDASSTANTSPTTAKPSVSLAAPLTDHSVGTGAALDSRLRHSIGGSYLTTRHSSDTATRPTGLAALKPYTAVKAQRYSYGSGTPLLPRSSLPDNALLPDQTGVPFLAVYSASDAYYKPDPKGKTSEVTDLVSSGGGGPLLPDNDVTPLPSSLVESTDLDDSFGLPNYRLGGLARAVANNGGGGLYRLTRGDSALDVSVDKKKLALPC